MTNYSSIFSFPLPLSYLERRFVLKHNLHLFRVQRVFWSLGNFEELPKEANKAWQMQSSVLRDLKSQRKHDSEKSIGSRSLKGSSTFGRLGLEGLLLFVYSNFILQWINYCLEGGGKVFHQVLQFPLRQHVLILSCICISLPLLLCFTFIVCCSCLCTRVVISSFRTFTLILHFD